MSRTRVHRGVHLTTGPLDDAATLVVDLSADPDGTRIGPTVHWPAAGSVRLPDLTVAEALADAAAAVVRAGGTVDVRTGADPVAGAVIAALVVRAAMGCAGTVARHLATAACPQLGADADRRRALDSLPAPGAGRSDDGTVSWWIVRWEDDVIGVAAAGAPGRVVLLDCVRVDGTVDLAAFAQRFAHRAGTAETPDAWADRNQWIYAEAVDALGSSNLADGAKGPVLPEGFYVTHLADALDDPALPPGRVADALRAAALR